MGILLGLIVAYFLKIIDLRHTPMLELSAYILIMYAPFVLAEICRMSGIVTVLFTGLAARRYAEPNLSRFASENSDIIFRLVAHVTETLVFLELGLSVVTILRNGFDVVFVLSALLACLIARALHVYPIVMGYNIFQRLGMGVTAITERSTASSKCHNEEHDSHDGGLYFQEEEHGVDRRNDYLIPRETTHFLLLAGLRGAVSYGLVKIFPDNNGNKITFEITTMMIVLITTFVFGGCTDYALTKLNIPVGVDEGTYIQALKQDEDLREGWWHRFERDRINPWVFRDFIPPAESSSDEFIYQEQVEVTDTIREGAFDEQNRKKESIYDFGQ